MTDAVPDVRVTRESTTVQLVVADHRTIIVDNRVLFTGTIEIVYGRKPGRPWTHICTLVRGFDRCGDPSSIMFSAEDQRAPDWIIHLRLDHYPHGSTR